MVVMMVMVIMVHGDDHVVHGDGDHGTWWSWWPWSEVCSARVTSLLLLLLLGDGDIFNSRLRHVMVSWILPKKFRRVVCGRGKRVYSVN